MGSKGRGIKFIVSLKYYILHITWIYHLETDHRVLNSLWILSYRRLRSCWRRSSGSKGLGKPVCLLCWRKDSGVCLYWCPLTLSSVEWSPVIRHSKAISLVPRCRNPRASSELLLNLPPATSLAESAVANEAIAGGLDKQQCQVQSVVRKKQAERRGAEMFRKRLYLL